MSHAAVRRALELHLAAMPGGLPTAHQNVKFTPPLGQPYQRADLLPATPNNDTAGASYFEVGVFQITLAYPLGNGPGAAEAQAGLLRQHFKRSTALTNSGVSVVVMTTPAIAQGTPAGDRFEVPVSVTFQARINP